MKPSYLINDARNLDREFYSGYDERFLYYKVKALGAILADPDFRNGRYNTRFLERFLAKDTAPVH